ncbi:hypothetical protein ACIRPK_13790 [Kitasatospora sp. NPDC101801]|uniref:hypothetical protein n=1 Tax=Kitasatospora sp. NPDC101801 TaxID=3364103 RepID=UPI0037FF6868
MAHWLAGTRPRDQVCALICQVLTRELGRGIGLQEAGLAPRAGQSDPSADQPVLPAPHDRLRELTEDTPIGLKTLRRLPYLLDPDLPEVAGRPRPEAARGRIGTAHIQAAELMVALFADADEVFGGAHLRPALTAYLSTDIASHLAAPASPSVSRKFRQASVDLAYLAGFTAFDAGLHGAAQAYFRIAAQLASEVSDRPRYAMTLRQMSVQAHHLGNTQQSLQFAQAAARETGGLSPRSAAFVTGQEALALAATGDRQLALIRLGQAERLLEQGEGSGAPLGGYHRAAFAHQQAEVLAAAGDIRGACRALTASLRHRPRQERRARMLTTARLAGLQLGQGHLELACSTWDRFLDDYPQVMSARGDTALRELRTGLRTYQREPAARRVLLRAGQLPAPRAGTPSTAPRRG